MLGDANIIAVLAVKDLDEAKSFYGDKLGLREVKEGDESGGVTEGGVTYQAGQTQIFVYTSGFAGSNKATAAACKVDDLEKVVADLKSKGVQFEHYDMPDVKMEGDIHVLEHERVAWAKDPSGNLIAINSKR